MKTIPLIGFIVLVALGCAAKPTLKVWVETPPYVDDAFYGVGESSKRSPTLAKQTATGFARAEIAQGISIKVMALLRYHLEQSGIGSEAQITEYSEAVGKQIAEVTLQNTRIKDTQRVEKSGIYTFYVLVEYPLGSARKMAADIAKQTMQREEALFNQYRAEQGFERMEKEIATNLDTNP